MAIAGRCRIPLLLSLQLTLLLTAANVSGLPEWHYQRHVDMYRARYHQRTTTPPWSDTEGFRGSSRYHLPQRRVTPPHLSSGSPAETSEGQNHRYSASQGSQRWKPHESRARWRRQRPHPSHHRHYHERNPAHYIRDQQVSSSRRADTEPVWLEDTVPSQDSEPAPEYLQRPHSAAESTGTQHNRLLNGEISVEIGQSSRNFSVRDGVVIGAEHVKLWRISGSDTAELSEKGGRLWTNNGTALFRRDDFSDGGVISNEIGDYSSQDKEKEPKFFFPLFTIIRFPNEPCSSDQQDGFTASGTCFLPSECAGNGGLARGPCALGFGVCCVFTLSCGGTTDKNGTFFVNPEYPSTGTTARTCSFSVNKISPDVSQIRLDFEEFTLAGPTEGSCNTDTFSVSGQNTNAPVPTLCGQNTGQHVFVEVGEQTGPLQLRVVTGAGGSERRWRVRVTQLTRRSEGAAPPNCLQYHTGQLGSIESFNYPAVGDNSGYLNQLNYMICIRKESGFCSITYGVDRFDQFSNAERFEIFNVRISVINGVTVVRSTVPPGQAGVGPVQCPDDYLLLSADRLCGDRLNDGTVNSQLTQNADVTDATGGQFTVKFVTNESTVGRGFKLYFRQNPCRTQRTYTVATVAGR